MATAPSIRPEQTVSYRLQVNNLTSRLHSWTRAAPGPADEPAGGLRQRSDRADKISRSICRSTVSDSRPLQPTTVRRVPSRSS